jgi:hypothetical protein
MRARARDEWRSDLGVKANVEIAGASPAGREKLSLHIRCERSVDAVWSKEWGQRGAGVLDDYTASSL